MKIDQSVLDQIITKNFASKARKQPACLECSGTGAIWFQQDGHEFVKMCECKRRRRIMQRIQDSGVAHEFYSATLFPKTANQKAFVPDERDKSHREALVASVQFYEAAIDWYRQKRAAPWMVLEGPFGIGKTLLASSILMDLIRAGMGDCYMAKSTMIAYSIGEAIGHGGGESDVLETYRRCKVLVLDDLNPSQVRNPEQLADKATKIILERYDRGLPTAITTNDSRETLDRFMGGRLCSRFLGHSIWVQMKGSDQRVSGKIKL